MQCRSKEQYPGPPQFFNGFNRKLVLIMNKNFHVLVGIAVLLACLDTDVYAQNGGNGGKRRRKKGLGLQAKEKGGDNGFMAGAWKNGKTFSLLSKGCEVLQDDLAKAERDLADQKNAQKGGGRQKKKKLKRDVKFAKLAFCLLRCDSAASGVQCNANQRPEAYCGNLETTKMRLKKRIKKAQAKGNNGKKGANAWKMTLLTNQKNKVDTQMVALCDANR